MLLNYVKYYSIFISLFAIGCFLLVKYQYLSRRFYFNFTLIVGVIYFLVRITSIPTSSSVSFILFLTELIGILQFLYQREVFKYHALIKKTKKSTKFTISILICTYNEPISLVKKNNACS